MIWRVFVVLLFLSHTGVSQDITFKRWEKKILSNDSFIRILSSLKEESFEVSYDKKDVPKSLRNILERWNDERKCPFGNEVKFANPNEDFESTDCALDPQLPTRQIILILKNNKHVVITYKHGGIGLHNHILWAEFQNGFVKDIWVGVASKCLDSKAKIQETLNDKTENLNTNLVCY